MAISKIKTTLFGDKRRYRAYKARVGALPESYRTTIEALERYLYIFGPGKGEPILQMLDDLADLFDQSAAAGLPVRDVVGPNPVEFAEAFVANYPEGGWITRERQKLIAAVDQAAARET